MGTCIIDLECSSISYRWDISSQYQFVKTVISGGELLHQQPITHNLKLFCLFNGISPIQVVYREYIYTTFLYYRVTLYRCRPHMLLTSLMRTNSSGTKWCEFTLWFRPTSSRWRQLLPAKVVNLYIMWLNTSSRSNVWNETWRFPNYFIFQSVILLMDT